MCFEVLNLTKQILKSIEGIFLQVSLYILKKHQNNKKESSHPSTWTKCESRKELDNLHAEC